MSKDFDFLSFPLHGSQLIEASAGTGKTFSLALLYTRLVLGHGTSQVTEGDGSHTGFNRPLTPKEILVVTFTEAAAGELCDRIRARLVEAAAFFQDKEAEREDSDPLHRLRASYPKEQWPACAWKLKLAAESMDEASISTIHGWCNRVLTEHAFDTRGLFNRELVTDQSELLHQVVNDYWRKHFYPLPADQVAMIEGCYRSPGALYEELKWLVKSGGHNGLSYKGEPLKITDFEQLQNVMNAQQAQEQQRLELDKEARQAWLDEFDAIREYLLSIRSRLNGTTHGTSKEPVFLQWFDDVKAWAQGEAEAPNKLETFIPERFNFKKNQEVELQPFAAFQALAELYNPPPLNVHDSVDPELPLEKVILAHAYHWVKQEFGVRMQQRAEMGFDDLLTELWQGLQGKAGGHLAEVLAKNYPVALIDEFQDTDPVQYGIFDAIYQVEANSPNTGLIMIGDPKQAIYSFRGADIHTYLKAREATTGTSVSDNRHYTLKKNFRSTKGIVDACNYLFSHSEQHPRASFRFKGTVTAKVGADNNPVPYVTVDAAGKADRFQIKGSAVKPLTLFAVEPRSPHEKDESGYLIAQTDYRKQTAEIAGSQIVDWLDKAKIGAAGFGENTIEKNLQPKDIAVLVRTGAEASLIRNALHQRNVPSVYLSDRESVFASTEAQDLLYWLRACAEPSDEGLVRAALGTNTLDLPLSQLALWREDELGWEQQMLTFIALRQVWYQQGVLALVRELLERYQVAARLLQKADGERAMTNILHLAEWLQQASLELRGDQALIRHLAEQIEAHDEQHILRLESDADLVKVITIHKSKGLEYPIVMLPFIGSWKKVDGNTKVVNWRSDSAVFKEISGDSKSEAWTQADDERLSEDMRLLYVALTRASHLLWLAVGAIKETADKRITNPHIQRSSMGYLLNGGHPVNEPQAVIDLYKQLADGCPEINWLDNPPPVTQDCYQPPQLSELAQARETAGLGKENNWWVASYSSIGFGRMSDADSEESTEMQPVSDTPEIIEEPETGRESTAEEFADEDTGEVETPVQQDRFIHQFPGGADWGTFLHSLMEWSAEQSTRLDNKTLKGFAAVAADDELRKDRIYRLCQLRKIQDRATGLEKWLKDFLQMRWQFNADAGTDLSLAPKDLQLSELSMRQVMVEMEFLFASNDVHTTQIDRLVREMTLNKAPRPMALFNSLNGMLKGFIDLVVEYQGRYYVVDWKSNKLGKEDKDYTYDNMLHTILKKRYDLQYVLYTLALHRQLKNRLPDYDYDTHIGGAVYVFLRGWKSESQGLFYDRPSKALIETLDRLFSAGGKAEPKDASVQQGETA